ncbi:MAG: hypothetical protein A3H35_06545 [Betaproteobacteria bacterium RIFCSPLOWO2_02_FULL_62_17]|nr:MAG: hypothetical protein A3H35_06545 [Betaproteobacteria bacterium RIFCSPLOWO2_02_FULL_62_17]
MLLCLQYIVACVIYFDFMSGRKYFAFADAGNDSYFQYIPLAMHLANYLATEGFPGWSFQVGLGANLGMLTDPFLLASTLFGAEAVPGGRIWFYLLKIACGGAFFLGGLLALELRREAALASALAFSFCGYMLIDGQWDSLATEYVSFSLIFWALARQHRQHGLVFLPLAIAAAAASSSVFMPFFIGIFLVYVFIAELLVCEHRSASLRRWAMEIAPLALIGMLLAAPIIIPNVIQLLDSPRVSASQATFYARLAELLSVNDWLTIFSELAGFWHKSLLGVGSDYRGWMNYLEGPGFYVGVLPLLLIPQLRRGSRRDRAYLTASLAMLVFYVLSPFLRFAAFGFSLNYFRVSTLWVAMLLLVLSARALSIILEQGIDRKLLVRAGLVPLALLGFLMVFADIDGSLNLGHALKVLVLYAAAFTLLYFQRWQALPERCFAAALIALVAIDAISIGWSEVNQNRPAVTPETFGYNDDSVPLLRALKRADPDFYRVEKTYESVSLCDSLAQDYFGVKSYYFQGSGVVDFHAGLGLLPAGRHGINYTNWLHGLDDRFMLHSLLGVKYVISRKPIGWPGFQAIDRQRELTVYRNDYALPLGIVQERQYPRERFAALPLAARDQALLEAVIVDQPVEGIPRFDDSALATAQEDWVARRYAGLAEHHQRSGLQLESFSHQRIVGRVAAEREAVLVFSIPASPGWTVHIDGRETPTFRANLGMLAVRIGAGRHGVEIRHHPPGAAAGMWLSLFALVALFGVWWHRRSRRR